MIISRILIVDDEAIHRRFARLVLESAQWAVDEADCGGSALTLLGQHRYQLVLLDLQMPGQDGYAVARAVRNGGALDPAVPILAFTSLRGAEMCERIALAGMDGHIPKPTTVDALVAAATPWQGRDGPDPLRQRLSTLFGKEEFGSLIDGFAAQLREAVEAVDGGAEPADIAHRIAGIAGTLGFPDVSATWLSLSEGDRTAGPAARLAALRALAAIDRDRG